MNVIVVAECDELWSRPHKIRCHVRSFQNMDKPHNDNDDDDDDDDHPTKTIPVASEAAIEIHAHILNYIRTHGSNGDSDSNSNGHGDDKVDILTVKNENIHVEIHNPNDGSMQPLLHLQSMTMGVGVRTSGSHKNVEFFHTYGTRIRCTIEFRKSGSGGSSGSGSGRNESPPSLPLMIKGRYFEYSPEGVSFAGKTLMVEEVQNNQVDGTGLNVWDGSLLLAKYLELVPDKVQSKSVLELGSGPAFVGIAAAVLGASEVVVSDLEYTLPLMRKNIELNRMAIEEANCKRIECKLLDWFDPPPVETLLFDNNSNNSITNSKSNPIPTPYPEVILIADCVWVEDLVHPLMNTVEQVCGDDTLVIITYQRRGKAAHDIFWKRLGDIFSNGTIEMVDTKERLGLDKPESISLLHCRR